MTLRWRPRDATPSHETQRPAAAAAQLFEDWFAPIETALRERVHGVIQAMIEAERDEVTADDNDMIHAASAVDIEKKRKAFVRKWRLRCAAVADCLEEAGDRLFAFTKLPANGKARAGRMPSSGCTPP